MRAPLSPDDRVLVRLPSWLGDLVMAEPVVRALVRQRDRAGGRGEITLAGGAHLLSVLDGVADPGGDLAGARRLALHGRRDAVCWRGHDVALLLTGSFRSAWTAWRAGIPRRVGLARDGRAPLLTDRLAPPLERGRVPLGLGRAGRGRRFLPRPFGSACAELLGLLGVSVADTRPRLVASTEGAASAAARLARLDVGGDFVLVGVGARPGSAKGLPPEAWARVLEGLAAVADLPLLLVCGPGEEAAVREALARASGPASTRARALVDPPAGLPELVALCERARLFLTADAGPRHVAAAVGTPVVVVAGPTDPRHTADHTERQRLVRVEVPCGPCHRERCPLEGAEQHACMRHVDPDEIVARAVDLLDLRLQ